LKLNTLFNPKEFFLSLSLFSLAGIVILLAPDSIDLLRYHRSSVNDGELWRLITANFCHSSFNHWVLNMTGLVLIDYFFQPYVTQKQRAKLILFCIGLNVVLIHLLLDNNGYVGLSGALNGYLFCCSIICFKQEKLLNTIVLLVVSVKLLVELNWSINESTEAFIQARVLEESHLYGTVSAVIYCLLRFMVKFFKSDNT
jgi:rhomboid family GlyGly-CTERM serine protease